MVKRFVKRGDKRRKIAMPKRLVIDLVGRICMVRHHGDLWALFVKIDCEPVRREREESEREQRQPEQREPEQREHVPLLSVPLSMLKWQTDANRALLTGATFVQSVPKNRWLVDKLGLFPIGGYDITITNPGPGPRTVDIEDAADLNAIVESVAPGTKFETGIVTSSNPSGFGVMARLRLPDSGIVTAITEDPTLKTFDPGGHTQRLASYVRCVIPFESDLKPPALKLEPFKGIEGPTITYDFNATKYELTLTMSNLCNDISMYSEYDEDERENDGKHPVDVPEDPEFKAYYQFVKGGKLEVDRLPVPKSPVTYGAIRIPVCYTIAQLDPY